MSGVPFRSVPASMVLCVTLLALVLIDASQQLEKEKTC